MFLGKFTRTRKNYKTRKCEAQILTIDREFIYIEVQDTNTVESASLCFTRDEIQTLVNAIREYDEN